MASIGTAVKPLLLTGSNPSAMIPRFMTRAGRIQFPGAWYHASSRGNERRVVFSDDGDRA